MSHSRRQEITFGLELEFLARSCDGSADGIGPRFHAPTRKALALELCRLTRGLGIAAQCRHPCSIDFSCDVCKQAPATDKYPGMTVFNASPPDHVSYVRPHHQYFLIEKEDLASLLPGEAWRGIKITTPAFTLSELSAGLPQTRQVVSALRRTSLGIAANRSCGLHVHVGLREGLQLTVAKKLVTLMMLVERPLILPLCPASRRECSFASPISEMSRFVKRQLDEVQMAFALRVAYPEMRDHWPWEKGDATPTACTGGDAASLHDTMRLIWYASSSRQVMVGLCKRGATRSALAISLRAPNSVPAETASVDANGNDLDFEGTQSTFEFRYPQMSFDVPFIKSWAELFCKLVEIATLDAPAFKAKLREVVSALHEAKASGSVEWEKILIAIGLGHQASEWHEQLRRHARGEAISHLGEGGMLLPE